MWKLKVPPKIHTFLWLLAKNKLPTRDNLEKRKMGKPTDCVFCAQKESINHLFFECAVAQCVWAEFNSMFQQHISDFVSLAGHWVNHKTMAVLNLMSAAVL